MTRPPSRRPGPLARLLRIAVGGVLAGLVLLTLAQRLSPISPWWLELTRYAPYPLWLAPAGVALLLSLGLGGRWVVASLATLALVATLTMGWVWNAAPTGAAPGAPTLRVMTYNIKAYKAGLRPDGFDRLAAEIARHDPDIVLVQDAHPLSAPRTADDAVLFGTRERHHVGQYVIASRYPLRDCRAGRLDVRGDDVGTLQCTVRVGGTDLDLVTVHFDSPRDGLNAARREGLDGADEWRRNYEDRLDQARLLARQLGPAQRPRIVAGDLNAPEASPVVRALLATGLRDAHSAAGRGYGYTYGQALRIGRSFLRIDHILVSPGIEVIACGVGGGEASEHRPVIADLRLPRP